jgi:hypothetical protein
MAYMTGFHGINKLLLKRVLPYDVLKSHQFCLNPKAMKYYVVVGEATCPNHRFEEAQIMLFLGQKLRQ